MPVSVTTRSYDFTRSGANTAETVLTPAAVRTRGVKQALVLRTPDDPRLEAQPLYLAEFEVGGLQRDVIIQATMGNRIYAWDADTGDALWRADLGPPVQGALAIGPDGKNAIDSNNTNVLWGVLSTPVIDRAAGRLYVCYWSSADGIWTNAHHFLARVDLATGAVIQPVLDLEGVTFHPGGQLEPLAFNTAERKQRAALSMLKGAVLIPFGSVAETGGDARGWLIAVDIASWSFAAAWCSTVEKGGGGGIWMSGAGPAIGQDGSIWLVTGNGKFDGVHNFGESVVRLSYTPPARGSGGALSVTGWWTPWTDAARRTGNPGGARVAALLPKRIPTNFRLGPFLAARGMADLDDPWLDQDLGASGIVLVEELGIGLVSGKDGILYTIRLDHPGNTTKDNLTQAKTPANYDKLATPPILYTFFDPGVQPAPPNPAALNKYAGNKTHHLHGTPLVWKTARRGWMHFCGGENGNLRAWQIEANRSSTYLACGQASASPNAGDHGGMPGWSINLSANGSSGGVVWAMMPYGDANLSPPTQSRLLAYDAEDFARFGDGGGEIMPLWDSQDWGWNMLHPKFNRPVPVDGKVLVPTYGGALLVLTLA
jgi:hypothetical protein